VTHVTWEQPRALWLLLAILLLLFARSTIPEQRIAVANLFLWADLESRKASALSRRLRRHWLLLLQAAFVAVVVVTLARPLISFGGQRSVIVLDLSMSMGALDGPVTRLDTAKAQTLSLVQNLPLGGRATIWLAGADVAVLGEFGRADASLESELQPLRATDAATDLDLAIEKARSADPDASRVHVVSDTAPPDKPGVSWVPVGVPADNAAITAIAARRSAPGGPVAILVAVRNFGAAAVASEVVIMRAASVLARRSLTLPAGAESNVVVEVPDVDGVVGARLELADALAADNTRFTIVAPATPLRALLIGRNHWLEQALAVHRDVTVVAGTSADAEADRTDLDLVICASCDDVPPAGPRAGVLLVPPPSASPREPSALVVLDTTHPLLQGLNADGALVSPIGGGSAGGGAEVLARAATLPVIVTQEHEQRRVVELRIDPSASGITRDVTFPLFVANAVEWLAAPRRRPTVLVAGEPLRVVVRDGADEEMSVNGPDGRNVPARRVGHELVTGHTTVAGLYHVTADGRDVDFVVNPAVERESDLSIGRQATPTASAALDARPYPTGITQGLLLTALALLAIEWRQRSGGRR
jgi:Ca-activated chloride channel family protein